ncbi:hypothetical protein ABNF65_15775 [Paenibacillus larvae]
MKQDNDLVKDINTDSGVKDQLPQEQYSKHLLSTINETFAKYKQDEMLKQLEKQNIVRLKKNKRLQNDETLDLSDIETDQQLSYGISSNNKIIRHYEKNEFLKSYRYSALFNVNSIEDTAFEKLQQEEVILDFFSPEFNHDILFNEFSFQYIKPTKYAIGNVIILKFSRLLTAYVPGSGEKKEIKYPILCVFFKHLGVLEIRLDSVKNYFQEDEFFYHRQIEFVQNWLKNNIHLEIENINLPAIIDFINKQEQDDVIIDSQAMSLASGGKAVLEIGMNENYILPLLGELKELIKSNEELFEQSPEIKKLLDLFISDTETNADLPWMTLNWRSKDKNSGTKVKFRHNYMNQGYTFLQYYGMQSDMRKMDDVTKYIIENRNKLDQKKEDESKEAEKVSFTDSSV